MRFVYGLALAAMVAMGGVSASQAAADGADVAVVNLQMILKDSLAAVSLREQIEGKMEQYQKEISGEEEKLRSEEQELSKQRTILSPEALEDRKKDFRKQVTDVQRNVQRKKAQLDRAYGKALSEVQKAIQEIIGDLAQEKGFEIAIPTSQILYATQALDISEEVQARLNKKLPKVKLVIEDLPDEG